MSRSRHGSSGGRRISALLFSLLSRVSGWLDGWRRRRQARRADAAASQRTSLLQFEALEPRLLLSADLVAGSLSHNAFDPVLPGDPVGALFEIHRPDSEPLSGPIRIQLYASTDSSLDAADTPVGQADIPASQLQPGANTISLSLDTRAVAEPGRYSLIGVIDPDNTIGESDEGNNQAIATQDFNLAFSVGQLPGRNPVPSIEFADADGTRLTLAISGPGIADLSADGAGYRLTISGSDASTRVELTGSGGDGRVILSGISAASPLGSLNAAIARLEGAATFAAASSLLLSDIATGARLDGNSLASLSVTRDALGDLRLAGSGVSGFVLGSAQVGGAIGGLWSISGRGNSVSAQTTRADWRANFSAPLTQLAVRGNASGQFAASALQILQVGGSLKGMDVRIGANLGSDAVLGGSGDAADQFGPGTLARLRVSGDIEDSTIVVGLDPRNGTYLDGDDQQLGTPTQRVQELLVGGQLKGSTQIVAPAFPASVRVGGVTLAPPALGQLASSPPDRTAPTLDAALLDDSGTSASDGITRDPGIGGQATDAGGVARLLAVLDPGGSAILADLSSALLGDGSFVLTTAILDSLAGGKLADGGHTLRLLAEDATGNRSAPVEISFTLDRNAPDVAAELDPAFDTGQPGDRETTAAVVDLLLHTEAGAQVQLLDATGQPLADAVADTSGHARFAGVALLLGENRFSARTTDAAGNSRAVGLALTRLAPDLDPPVISLQLANDSGASDQDGITNDPRVIGTVSDGSPIASLRAGFDSAPATFVDILDTVQPDGHFALDSARLATIAAGPLSDGLHTLTLLAEDAAGNTRTASVTFTLDTLAPIAPTFGLSVASDTGSLGDGITSAAIVSLVGNSEEGTTVTLSPANEQSLAGNGGVFRLANIGLASGSNSLILTAVDAAGNVSQPATQTLIREGAIATDSVSTWHAQALAMLVRDAEEPTAVARTLAMESLAVLDVINAFEGTPAFAVKISAPTGASLDAAIAGAAHRVLTSLYPAQSQQLDASLAASLAPLGDGDAKTAGLALGRAVADAILASRSGDGYRDFVDYPGSTAAGAWRPTEPTFAVAASPQWADVKPFVLAAASALRPPAPPALGSARYAADLDETRRLGEFASQQRTADQSETVHFWADGLGTPTPSGHWNQIAAQIADSQGLGQASRARLLAELNVALADAGIAAWDAKYAYGLWRPETAIREADTDGNDQTQPDEDWRPLLITPNHPEYVSGHSTYSAAAAAVLSSVFGEDFAFDTGSPGLSGVVRQFTSFEQAADEAGRSRIFGGIHYEFTNQAGQTLGRDVAAAVLERFSLARDMQAPTIAVNASQQVTAGNSTLRGRVLDNIAGVASFEVRIDGDAFAPIALDADGKFSLTTSFALDGSADGVHTLEMRASDAAGNAAPLTTLALALDTRAPVISLTNPAAGAALTADMRLAGIADGNGSALTALSYTFDGGAPIPLLFASQSGVFDAPVNLGELLVGDHTLRLRAVDAAGNVTVLERDVTLNVLPPLTVTQVTPAAGSEDVGSTFRPQVFFSRAIDTNSLTADTFYATDTTGSRLDARIVVGDGGRFAWLFFANPMPGASVITVHLKSASIRAATGGQALDADGDGNSEAEFSYRFSTVSLASVPGTILRGKVVEPGDDLQPMTYDDLRRGPDGVPYTSDDVDLHPLANVEVVILGRPDLHTYTDADGLFELADTPVGNVKVVINGRTASNAPGGFFFPEMTMDLTLEAGRVNTMMGSMGAREVMAANEERLQVYLPRLQQSMLRPVDNRQPQTITLDPESAPNLTAEQISRLRLEFVPGSLIGENGLPMDSAQIGISIVPPELVRDMMPPGVTRHGFDITIQAPGVAAFTTPLPISFPNDVGLAPGTRANLLSFDHTTGRLEVRGSMTVSEDGTMVVSDPGTGITQPGWHWWLSNSNGNSGGPPPIPPNTPVQVNRLTPTTAFLTGDTGSATIPSIPIDGPTGGPQAAQVVYFEVDGPLSKFVRVKIDGQEITSWPYSYGQAPGMGPHTFSFEAKPYDGAGGMFFNGFASLERDQLYGARITVTTDYSPGNGQAGTRTINTQYVYRWVDVVDAEEAINRTGNTAAFFRTLADGFGGLIRTKNVDLHLPSSVTPTRFAAATSLPNSPFYLRDGIDVYGTRMQTWGFDPSPRAASPSPLLPFPGYPGNPDVTFARQPWGQEFSILVTDEDPRFASLEVGRIVARGTATPPTTVSVDTEGLTNELVRVIKALRPAASPGPDGRWNTTDDTVELVYDFGGGVDADGKLTLSSTLLPEPQRELSWPGRAGIDDDENGVIDDGSEIGLGDDYVTVASAELKSLFREFLPGQGYADADLRQRAASVAEDVFKAVDVDFLPFSGAIKVVRSNVSSDVDIRWEDIRGAPSGPVQPLADGLAGVGGESRQMTLDGGGVLRLINMRPSIISYLREQVTTSSPVTEVPISEAAKQWALAESLNEVVNDRRAHISGPGFALSVDGYDDTAVSVSVSTSLRWEGDRTYAQFLAAPVSHEIAHTFGLGEGYVHRSPLPPRSVIASDIMGVGGRRVPDVYFTSATRGLIEAAIGRQPNGDLPLTQSLRYYRDSFPWGLWGLSEVGAQPGARLGVSIGSVDVTAGDLVPVDQASADGPGGSFAMADLLLRNGGGSSLVISGVSLESGHRGFLISDAPALGSVLSPGDQAVVRVIFDPALAGSASDRLLLTTNSQDVSLFALSLGAVGLIDAPVVTLSSATNLGGLALDSGAVERPNLVTIENLGANPLLISSIHFADGGTNFDLLDVPLDLASNPVSLSHGETFSFGARFTPGHVGLHRDLIEITTNDPTNPTLTASVVGTGLAQVVYPDWGNDYIAIEFPNLANATTLRTQSDASGNFQIWIPPNEAYHEVVFDPETGLVAHSYGRTSAVGDPTDLSGTLVFAASTAPDSDFDGLPDDIEFATGSSSASRDTDKDGLDDFAEINLNLNPLDGRGLPAGVLAVTGMRGEAKELVLAGRIDGAAGQTIYLATGSHGLAIVDARDLRRPIVVGQLDLPGDAVDVALDARLGIAAVATGTSLEVVDVSNPSAPTVLRSIPMAAAQVEVVDGVAYVAVGSNIEAYDLLTGDHRQTVPSGAGTIAGLTADRDFLFAADAAGWLAAIDISGSAMAPTGVVSLPANSGRVFVGGGVAYVGGGSGEFNGGFVTVDVSNPAAMALISGADNTSIAGKSVVANGAGLALAVGKYQGGFPNFEQRSVLDVVDATDPANTGTSAARFVLPSPPHSLALGSGLAFVADGSAGLVVANYLPFDTLGQAPVVTVTTPGADVDPASVGIQAREGSTLTLDVGVVDDRQIRNVEVLVDGRVVGNDVAYPWPSRLTLPKIAGIDDTVTIQVRAADTGGNVGLSAPITIQLVRDTVAPAIVSTNLPDGAVRGTAFRTVSIEFSEGIDPATVMPSTVVLMDGSGTPVVPLDMVLRRDGRELQLTYPTLAEGAYQLRLDAAAITDRAGNALAAAEIVTSFTISDTSTVVWIGSNSGFWDDAANWSSGRVPQANEDVVINVAPGGVIEHRNGDTAIRSLTTNATFRLSGGTLSLAADSSITGALSLVGGALDGTGTLSLLGTGNRWDGGAMRGGGTTRIANGADLLITGRQGALNLSDRTLVNEGSVLVDRGGSFLDATVFNLSGPVTIRNQGSFEIRSGAYIGIPETPIAGGHFDNRGLLKVTAARSGMGLALDNAGTLELADGAQQALGSASPVIISGSLVFGTNSSLDLRGTYTLADTAIITGSGNLNSRQGTLTIARSGELGVGLGIFGGTVEVSGTLRVRNLQMSGGVLTGAGTLVLATGSSNWSGGTMTGGGTTRIESGATLSLPRSMGGGGGGGSISIGIDIGGSPSAPFALGDRRLVNNGTFELGGTLELNGTATIDNAGAISIVDTGLLADSASPSGTLTINNLGSFALPAPGFSYELRGVTFNSTGALDAQAGLLRFSGTGNTSIEGAVSIAPAGAIEQAGGTSRIDPGGPVSGLGTLRVTGGTMALAAGSFDQTLVLRDGTMLIETPVTARFVDMTGGNLSGAGPLSLALPASELLGGIVTVPIVEPPDVVAPTVLSSSLSDGWAISLPNGVTDGVMIPPTTILFSEPMKPSTLNAANLHLLTSSGLSADPVSIVVRNDLRAATLAWPKLAPDTYRFVVLGQNVEDHRAGNYLAAGETTLATFQVRPESIPPVMLSTNLASQMVTRDFALHLRFSEAIDPNTLNAPGIQLSDGVTVYTPVVQAIDQDGAGVTLSLQQIPSGNYTLLPDNLRDMAGNSISLPPYRLSFQLIDAVWIGTAGRWDDPANWESGHVPQPGDRVFVSRPASGSVSVTGDVSIAGVEIEYGTDLSISGGTWSVTDSLTFQGGGSLTLGDGGAISGTQSRPILLGGVWGIRVNSSAGSPASLTWVQVQADVDLGDAYDSNGTTGTLILRNVEFRSADVLVSRGSTLVLDSDLLLDNAFLEFYGGDANDVREPSRLQLQGNLIDGRGYLHLGNTYSGVPLAGGPHVSAIEGPGTIGTDIKVYIGGNTIIGTQVPAPPGGAPIINKGWIEIYDGTTTVNLPLINDGTIEVYLSDGAVLDDPNGLISGNPTNVW